MKIQTDKVNPIYRLTESYYEFRVRNNFHFNKSARRNIFILNTL